MNETESMPAEIAELYLKQRIQIIALIQIKPSLSNMRATDNKLNAELAQDIMQNGLINPITVRIISEKTSAKQELFHYEIIAGERRFNAVKSLGKEYVTCNVIDDCSDEKARFIQASENIHRLNLQPLEELECFLALRKSLSIDQIAERIGKTKNYILSILQLEKLSERFRTLLAEGTLPREHALIISKFDPVLQKKLYEDNSAFNFRDKKLYQLMPAQKLEKYVFEEYSKPLDSAAFNILSATLTKAGSCALCPFNTGMKTDLFMDISEEALCTKVSCFMDKSEKHIRSRIKELHTMKVPYVLLYEDTYSPGSNRTVFNNLECVSMTHYKLEPIMVKKGEHLTENIGTIGIIAAEGWGGHHKQKYNIGTEFFVTKITSEKALKENSKKVAGEKEESPIEIRERRMLKRFAREDDQDKLEVRKLIMHQIFECQKPTEDIFKDALTKIAESVPDLYKIHVFKSYGKKNMNQVIETLKTDQELLHFMVKCYAAKNLREYSTKDVNIVNTKNDPLIKTAADYAIVIDKIHNPYLVKRLKERKDELESLAAAKKRAADKMKKDKAQTKKNESGVIKNMKSYKDPVPGRIAKIGK
jgi:ParB family chromosome partitioning protein